MQNQTEQTVTLTLSIQEVQILNDILINSVPSVNFGTVSKLVTNINTQIQAQKAKLEPKQLSVVTDEIPVES